MRLTRERDGKMVDLTTGAPWETVTLTTLFAYAHLFPQMLDEARQLALSSTEGKTVIYTSWALSGGRSASRGARGSWEAWCWAEERRRRS